MTGLNIVGANRSDGTDRQKEDYYATDPKAISDLAKLVDIKGKVWENACGEGNLYWELVKLPGVDVFGTDKILRHCHFYTYDFLGIRWNKDVENFKRGGVDWIISNPPYKHGKEWIEKSLQSAPNVAMLMKLVFLETEDGYKFFKTSGLKKVLVYSKRLGVYKDNIKTKNSGLVAYAWFVFERGYKGKPEIDWIL